VLHVIHDGARGRPQEPIPGSGTEALR
jgi:hypothetical protein